MTGISFSSLLVNFMYSVAILAGVPLAVATVASFIVSFLQAITQIQDQSLGQTIKISAVVIVFLTSGIQLSAPLMTATQDLFENFHLLVK